MSVSFATKNHENRVSIQSFDASWGVGGQTFSLTNSLGAQKPVKKVADSLKNARKMAGFTVSVLLNHIAEQTFKFSASRKTAFPLCECGRSRAFFEGVTFARSGQALLSFSKN